MLWLCPSLLALCVMQSQTTLIEAVISAAVPCATNPTFTFQSNAALGGRPSAITVEGEPIALSLGLPLAPVVILATDIPDGTVVSVTVFPTPVLLSGDASRIVYGVANFPALTLADNLPFNETRNNTADSYLVFQVTDASTGVTYKLSTGLVTQLSPEAAVLPVRAAFLWYGFIRSESLRTIPNAAPLGDFYVGAFDALGQVVAAQGTASVAVAPDFAGSLTPSGLTFSGTGAIAVSGLVYTSASLNATVLRATVTINQWSGTVDSELLTPEQLYPLVANDFLEFDPSSFITVDNLGGTGVMGVALPPIVLRLMRSDRTADTSDTGLVISATASQGTLVGGLALVVNGVATFSNLYFDNTDGIVPTIPYISFTVSPVVGKPLRISSGIITLALDVIRAKQMRFAPWSAVTSQSPAFLPVDESGIVRLPLTVVRFYDSGFALDPEARGFSLTVTADPPGVLSGGATCAVRYGLCAFANATFKLPLGALSRLTTTAVTVRFAISDADSAGATTQRRAPLRSEAIQLLRASKMPTRDANNMLTVLTNCGASLPKSPACTFVLSFVSDQTSLSSLIYAPGVAFGATVGTTLKPIRLRLTDPAGRLVNLSAAYRANAPRVVAYSSKDPLVDPYLRGDATARSASVNPSGEYVFDCLAFATAPSGLVRLSFVAIHPTFGVLAGLAVQSGFLRVATAPTSSFALGFSRSSFIAATGTVSPLRRDLQRSTAVAGVDLPPIVVEVVDSVNVVNTGDYTSTVTLVASASTALGPVASGVLDPAGATAVVTQGIATFTRLRFTSVVDDVTLTFTATQSATALTAAPVVGQTIQSGILSVTAWPARTATHMYLRSPTTPAPSAAVVIAAPFQSWSVVNISNIQFFAEFAFTDSIHSYVTAASAAAEERVMTFSVTSDQVVVPLTAATLRFDPTCACVRWNASGFVSWSSPAYVGDLIHFTATVVAAANPRLVGEVFTVGPITVSSAAASTSSVCGSSTDVSAPVVVGEFAVPVGSFDEDAIRGDLALVLGVEAERIGFVASSLTEIVRTDHSTLQQWVGSKVEITIADPRKGDLNRKPGSQLVTELSGYRASCGPQGLALRSAYPTASDRTCDRAAFATQSQAAKACLAQGILGLCQCYASNLLADDKEGPRCTVEQYAALQQICVTLVSCRDASIGSVCDTITLPARNYTGLYVSAVLILVVTLAGIAYQRYLQPRQVRSTLAT